MSNRGKSILVAAGVLALGALLVGGALVARSRREPRQEYSYARPAPRVEEPPAPAGPSAEERARSPLEVVAVEAAAALDGLTPPMDASAVIEEGRLPKRVELDALALALRRAEVEALKAFVVAHFVALADAEGQPSLAQYVIARWVLDAAVERRVEVELELARAAIRMLKAGGERRQTVAALIPSLLKVPGLADPVADVVRAVCGAKREDAADTPESRSLRCQAARALAHSGSMGHAEALVRMATLFEDRPPVGDAVLALGGFDEAMPYFLRVARIAELAKPAVEARYSRAVEASLKAGGHSPEVLLKLHEQETSEPVRRFLLLTFLRIADAGSVTSGETWDYLMRATRQSGDAKLTASGLNYVLSHGSARARIEALKESAGRDKSGDFARNLAKACASADPAVQQALADYAKTLTAPQMEDFVRHVGTRAQIRTGGTRGSEARPVLEAMRDAATDAKLRARIEGALKRTGK